MYPASTAPLSVSLRQLDGIAPLHLHVEGVVVARPSASSCGGGQGPRREQRDLGAAPARHLVERAVGHVDVDHHRVAREGGEDRLRHPGAHLGGAVPTLVGQHLVPALALHAVVGDRLAHREAGHAAVAGGERGPHGARVVDRPPRVGARVDAGDDEVEGAAEHAEPGEHHAQRRADR